MPSLGPTSIRQQLTLILMVTSSVAIVMACTVFITVSFHLQRRSMVLDLASLANVVGNNCQAAMVFGIPGDAQNLLASLRGKPSITYACLFDPNGAVFARYRLSEAEEDRNMPGPPLRDHYFERGSLHVFHEILLNGKKLGTLYLRDDLRSARAALRERLVATGVILVLALGTAFVISLRLQRTVAEPILALARIARTVSEKNDFTVRASLHAEGEIGILTTAINQMLSGIQERERSLKEFASALQEEVSERKKAEEQLRVLNATLELRVARRTEDLQRSNRDLEHFAYIASHDLQEPLRSVGSYVQILAQRYQGQLDAHAHEFVGFIVEGVKRMETLIHDLLAYSRVGTRTEPLVPVDCESALQAALADLHTAIEESGATIAHDKLPIVVANAQQLSQLFQNLIGNAIKFRREEPPRIRITARRVTLQVLEAISPPESVRGALRAGDWLFGIQDNGIGIAPEYRDRVFVIFQRLHSRARYSGNGIGLAICKRIVELLGGRIWLDSAGGEGSTFRFTLPEGRNADE